METIYFAFSDVGTMLKYVQLMWDTEDLMNVRHTAFAMSSDGYGDHCFMTRAEDMDMSLRLFRAIIKTQGAVVVETMERNPAIWDNWMAKLAGI